MNDATVDAGSDKPSLKGFTRKGVEGANVYGVLFTQTFPGIPLEKAWANAMNFTQRSSYDTRFVEPTFFEENDSYVYYYAKSPKPPTAIISQREFLVEGHKIPNGGGEGKHIFVSLNRVHPDKPIDTGFFSTVRAYLNYHGMVFEAIDPSNPDAGTKLTECRAWDMNGNIPAMAMNSVMPKMCTTPFE